MTQIITYHPDYKPDFIRLNKAWLNEYFSVEPHDNEVFNNLETLILQRGGEVFFCLHENNIVGTVALQPDEHNNLELSKMAVDKNFQGLGFANLLMEEAINYAIRKGVNQLFLLSNRKLEAAIRLYSKFGFTEIPLPETDYARADIAMALKIK